MTHLNRVIKMSHTNVNKIFFRERRDNYVPEISALENDDLLAVDPNVQAMIKALDFDNKDGLLETLKVEGGQ